MMTVCAHAGVFFGWVVYLSYFLNEDKDTA